MNSDFIRSNPTLSDISEVFIDPFKKRGIKEKIESSVPELTRFIGGGVRYGAVTEFGIPLYRGGKELFITLLSEATQNGDLTLWVNGHSELAVFPPAWSARGVRLSKILFTESRKPVEDLKKVFLSSLFKIVVLDTGKFQIKKGELAFLKNQARINGQAIIVIRNYFLSNSLGNIWVSLRVNMWKNHTQNMFKVKIIRGFPGGETSLSEKCIPYACSETPENSLRENRGMKGTISKKKHILSAVQEQKNHPCQFICIKVMKPDPMKLQCLSAHVMKWSEYVWIFDLRGFISYWESMASAEGAELAPLLRKTLETTFGEHSQQGKLQSIAPPYSAASAPHPWQALLLLESMENKKIKGFISLSSCLGKKLYESVSWDAWWRCVSQISLHFTSVQAKIFPLQKCRQFCSKLKLATTRLNFSKPGDMRILHKSGVQRRFGTLLGTLWHWTCSSPSYEEGGDFSWPWIEWEFRKKPTVTRTLDYSVSLWERLTPFLKEDLDTLLGKIALDAHERVTKLRWELSLDDETLTVPVHFRNPHNLMQERGEHKTTLFLSECSFKEAMHSRFKDLPEYSLQEGGPVILSWKIILEESVYVPIPELTLFENTSERKKITSLLKLENEISVPLKRYVLTESWVPEDSYKPVPLNFCMSESRFTPSLKAAAKKRPLFIYTKPDSHRLEAPETMRHLENTMKKWWELREKGEERCYYKIVTRQGTAFWASKKPGGELTYHGLFA